MGFICGLQCSRVSRFGKMEEELTAETECVSYVWTRIFCRVMRFQMCGLEYSVV